MADALTRTRDHIQRSRRQEPHLWGQPLPLTQEAWAVLLHEQEAQVLRRHPEPNPADLASLALLGECRRLLRLEDQP